MPTDFRGAGWDRRVELGSGVALLHWPAGVRDEREHYGFEHEHVWPGGERVLVAPVLDLHRITVRRSGAVTVRPSVLCDCGLHGWITGDVWEDAEG